MSILLILRIASCVGGPADHFSFPDDHCHERREGAATVEFVPDYMRRVRVRGAHRVPDEVGRFVGDVGGECGD